MTKHLLKTNNDKMQILKQKAFDLSKSNLKTNFKASSNPFNEEKVIQKTHDLAMNKSMKKYLTEFEEMIDRERMKLPDQLISFPRKMVRRVNKIEREETAKRLPQINDVMKFVQLKAYVNKMLDQGYSFKAMAKKEAEAERKKKIKKREAD